MIRILTDDYVEKHSHVIPTGIATGAERLSSSGSCRTEHLTQVDDSAAMLGVTMLGLWTSPWQ